MALKNLLNTLKQEGYIVKRLDQYLLSLNGEPDDRAENVNAPSQAGKCQRANYYSRIGEETDYCCVDARTRRIFDNGTKTHERLQEYLMSEGILVMEEVPLRNDHYQIQGHTDGILKLNEGELAVLEIKSINTGSFSQLKAPKTEHEKQAMIYLYCLEERRKYLRKTYKNNLAFIKDKNNRYNYYESLYNHLKDGHKYTREEKLHFKCEEHNKADLLLLKCGIPITKCIFLYENKDTQELKEFCVNTDEQIIQEVLGQYEYLNSCIETKTIPPREGTSKSSPPCKWCDYKDSCFIV